MATEKKQDAVNVVLSRDELVLVLSLLGVTTLPGLGGDPLGDLDAPRAAMSAVVAARGLRARDLARVRAEDGSLLVHVGVLGAVNACTAPDAALFVFHWAGEETEPQRWFGYRRGASCVVHRPLEDVLHRFTVLAASEQLVEQALATCQVQADEQPVDGVIDIKGSDFARLRQLAGTGAGDQALALLAAAAAPPRLALALVKTLAASPQVSILQLFTRAEDGATHQQDFTLLQNGSALWLMTPVTDDAERVHIQSVARTHVYDVLLRGLAQG
ncbi:MAG: hypothetical protein WAZ19_11775 [Anaerolineae bacterium]